MQMKHCFIMLDYPSLAAVSAVVREGSFEKAAERLGVTPSAVSQRVRNLEERLGAILIIRGQPCVATELGGRLCAHVDHVQLMEADLEPMLSAQGERSEIPLTLKVAVNSDSISTWFPKAAADFARSTGHLLDLLIDDEAHTADRLRSGEVVAAVTADPEPVQGCKTISLGGLIYRAYASPDFMGRHFANGITEETLRRAPCLRFERRDGLQARWAREIHGIELNAPMHWVPSTSGFLKLAAAGMAWGMQPEALARPLFEDRKLVELSPGTPITVDLYWIVARLSATPLLALTDAVRSAAKRDLS